MKHKVLTIVLMVGLAVLSAVALGSSGASFNIVGQKERVNLFGGCAAVAYNCITNQTTCTDPLGGTCAYNTTDQKCEYCKNTAVTWKNCKGIPQISTLSCGVIYNNTNKIFCGTVYWGAAGENQTCPNVCPNPVGTCGQQLPNITRGLDCPP